MFPDTLIQAVLAAKKEQNDSQLELADLRKFCDLASEMRRWSIKNRVGPFYDQHRTDKVIRVWWHRTKKAMRCCIANGNSPTRIFIFCATGGHVVFVE